MENDAEIFPVHYTLKVAEKGFKMASMMNKLAMINSCEIILEKENYFFAKNHCDSQVRNILVCTLYSIKYGTLIRPLGLSTQATQLGILMNFVYTFHSNYNCK